MSLMNKSLNLGVSSRGVGGCGNYPPEIKAIASGFQNDPAVIAASKGRLTFAYDEFTCTVAVTIGKDVLLCHLDFDEQLEVQPAWVSVGRRVRTVYIDYADPTFMDKAISALKRLIGEYHRQGVIRKGVMSAIQAK